MLGVYMEEIFDSSVRSNNDFAGVFEFDGDVGYFYLYKIDPENGNKVINSIRVCVGEIDFNENLVDIVWNKDEKKVGLKIKDCMCAMFELENGKKYGGNYSQSRKEYIPSELIFDF